MTSSLEKGLVGWWTCNSRDVDSGLIRDKSGYGHHGTMNGGITTGAQSPVGEGFSLDGSDDFVESSLVDLSQKNAFSTGGWLNYTYGSYQALSWAGNSSNNRTWWFGAHSSDGDVHFDVDGTSDADGTDVNSSVLSENTWHHVFGTFTSTRQRIYVDGSVVKENTYSGNQMAAVANHRISNNDDSSSSSMMSGTVSDIRVYNRELQPEEVRDLYNQRTTTSFSVSFARTKPIVSGGTEYTKNVEGIHYKIHEFTSDGTLDVEYGADGADVLVVGGGGGGGGRHGAGGGAGGVIYKPSYQLSQGSVGVTVGAGGAGGPGNGAAGNPGGNSVFGALTALGGGGGNSYDGKSTPDGGSGSGATSDGTAAGSGLQPGSADGGFGNSGGAADGDHNHGGGGGAGQPGADAKSSSNGGPGKGGDGKYFGDRFSDDFGDNGYFAGGGGGGSHDPRPSAFNNGGGLGGGGAGGSEPYDSNTDSGSTGDDGSPGAADTGGGGGGGSTNSGSGGGGGDGGSGIVLVRYKI